VTVVPVGEMRPGDDLGEWIVVSVEVDGDRAVMTTRKSGGKKIVVWPATSATRCGFEVRNRVEPPLVDARDREEIENWIRGIDDEVWHPSPATKRRLRVVLADYLAVVPR